MHLLEIQNVSMRFGGLEAIGSLDLDIEKGEIRGLIGPNGAGKTTLFNVISGVYRPTAGTILFKGQDITRLRPHDVTRLGVVRTFQAVTLFKNFTVLKNVLMGCHLHRRLSFWGGVFNTKGTRESEAATEKKAMEILDLMGLTELKDELALNLPHGHQRALGVAIGLAAEPELLMLDEPVTGMNPEETAAMMELVKRIRDRGLTILLIEHDMKAVMSVCERISVLDFGKKIAEGEPDEIKQDEAVIEAYLGSEYDVA